jgi:hypothetical protein
VYSKAENGYTKYCSVGRHYAECRSADRRGAIKTIRSPMFVDVDHFKNEMSSELHQQKAKWRHDNQHDNTQHNDTQHKWLNLGHSA